MEEIKDVKEFVEEFIIKFWMEDIISRQYSIYENEFKKYAAAFKLKFSRDDVHKLSKFVASTKDYVEEEEGECNWMNRFRTLTRNQQYDLVKNQQLSFYLAMQSRKFGMCRSYRYKNVNVSFHHKDLFYTCLKNSLYTLPYSSDKMLDQSCAVCLEEFYDGQFVRQLPCRHSFHHSCLHEWTSITTKCPTCRKTLVIRPTGLYNYEVQKNKNGSDILNVTLIIEPYFC